MSIEQKFFEQVDRMGKRGLYFNLEEYTPFLLDDNRRTELIGKKLAEISNNTDLKRTGNIEDMIDVRSILKKVLKDDFKYFLNSMGEICLDKAHLLVVYEIVKSRETGYYAEWTVEDIKKLLDIAFICKATWSFYKNIKLVENELRCNRFFPSITKSLNDFICYNNPHFFESYMLYGLVNQYDNSNIYTFENLYLLESYTISQMKGITYKEAEQEVRQRKKGYFLKDISIETECKVIKYIIQGDFLVLDGELGNQLLNENVELKQALKAEEDVSSCNYYTNKINPLLVKFFGRLIEIVEAELQVQNVDREYIDIVYATPERICLKVKNGVELQGILKYYRSFKKVDKRYLYDFFKPFMLVGDENAIYSKTGC